MPITRSQVQKRIEELKDQLQQYSNDMNAVSGALQDANYWLEFAEPDVHTLQKLINDFDNAPPDSPSSL